MSKNLKVGDCPNLKGHIFGVHLAEASMTKLPHC
jgi:hypothetical protein